MPKPAATLQREYLYRPQELCEALDLRGEKVIKVTFEFGFFSVWTEGEDADA